MSSEDTRELVEVLLVRIGDGVYGIETGHVVEVFMTPDLSPVPGTDDPIAGIDRYRGDVTLFLDPASVLDTITRGERAILVSNDTDETPIALLVDEVLAMKRFDTRAVAPAAEFDIDVPIFAAGVATEEAATGTAEAADTDAALAENDILPSTEASTTEDAIVSESGSFAGEDTLALICPRGIRKYTESTVAS